MGVCVLLDCVQSQQCFNTNGDGFCMRHPRDIEIEYGN